jgi:hypothetical protein
LFGACLHNQLWFKGTQTSDTDTGFSCPKGSTDSYMAKSTQFEEAYGLNVLLNIICDVNARQ